ncbi:eCIS core domain-containing protein [Rhizobacter sp. P5_C2]
MATERATTTRLPAGRTAPREVQAAALRQAQPVGLASARGACACGGGCPRCRGAALQRKPQLSTPGDRFEREADAVADQVMRMASATPVSAGVAGIRSLQRKCADCEDEVEGATIRREAAGAGAQSLDTESAARAAQQGGAPLSPDQRDFFEPRLGHDLGHVRVHTGGSAEAGASAVQARAYTLGRDIVFGSGEYKPGTPAGQRLLAHELVHVLQQGEHHPDAQAVQRTLKVDAAASDDPATAISTIKPLLTALCPDFDIAATGQVLPNKGSDCAGFKFGALAKGKQQVGCCCLCTLTAAPDAWRIVVTTKDAPTTDEAGRQVSMTPTAGPAAPSLSYWTAAQKVQTLPLTEAFGHELCGHAALMQIKAHPSSSAPDTDRAYSDVHDPTVRIENALATEMGLGGDRRGLAGSGTHRGESLRVFSVGPYAADADDPAPFAAQIKAAVDFLNGNELLLVDEIGQRSAADKTATVGKTRADKVEAALKKGIAKADVAVETTPGVDETLTRVRPATDGGVGATPGVELRMAIRPAGLVVPAGAAPPKAPVHVGPANPAVVAALKAKGAVNPCHVLLSGTAWP